MYMYYKYYIVQVRYVLLMTGIKNPLAVQNPRYKCDLGNKNDSVTDKKITADKDELLQ